MSTQPSSTQLPIVLSLVAMLLAGCSGHEPRGAAPSPASIRPGAGNTLPSPTPASAPGEEAALVAVRQVGVPYRYGGNNARGFDCSGLVQYAYAATGARLPRTTAGLWEHMQPVSGPGLEVGDVLFFRIEGKVSHVGLYLGSRRFVHAPATGREVTVADLDNEFYRNAFIRGGRLP